MTDSIIAIEASDRRPIRARRLHAFQFMATRMARGESARTTISITGMVCGVAAVQRCSQHHGPWTQRESSGLLRLCSCSFGCWPTCSTAWLPSNLKALARWASSTTTCPIASPIRPFSSGLATRRRQSNPRMACCIASDGHGVRVRGWERLPAPVPISPGPCPSRNACSS